MLLSAYDASRVGYVAADLFDEFSGRVELPLVAQPPVELDSQDLAVEVAVEVEQKGLYTGLH